ncbi:MAG: HD domain-containing protein [Nanoarchaeota archaeon]|nr:HD domain-containing protein [Nanoarchaeota archaeon]MBU4352724.1 HD domain-containing protein [Nanoarchaeota archaeon]MBU4456040.1 HD domain-containing protein [Nanoarchaeota archaeon]MCG2720111.1 HD domain-containing protein [Nanoarchaeota archaeon]
MEKFVKKQLISDLKDGNHVDDIFVVKIKKSIMPYKNKSGSYFQLILSDNTGKTLEYNFWGSEDDTLLKEIYSKIKSDSVIRVQGRITVYNDKLQLTGNEETLLQVLEPEQYNQEDFIKAAKKNIEELYLKLKNILASIENPQIKQLLSNIFNDSQIEKEFKKHPGAIEIHHNWIGGLLEHTLEVAHYCALSYELFHSLNRDLLLAGALLHDIGKLKELNVTSRIKGSTEGQLTGHLVLGTVYVHNMIDKIEGFDESLKNKILHLLISHHGKLEFGSPKEPMFAEALALYYADEISSKIAWISEFIQGAKEDTEDDFMYHPKFGKNIYLR